MEHLAVDGRKDVTGCGGLTQREMCRCPKFACWVTLWWFSLIFINIHDLCAWVTLWWRRFVQRPGNSSVAGSTRHRHLANHILTTTTTITILPLPPGDRTVPPPPSASSAAAASADENGHRWACYPTEDDCNDNDNNDDNDNNNDNDDYNDGGRSESERASR